LRGLYVFVAFIGYVLLISAGRVQPGDVDKSYQEKPHSQHFSYIAIGR
jgi:hypothetical protein